MSDRAKSWKWLRWVLVLAVLAGGAAVLWHYRQPATSEEVAVWPKRTPRALSPLKTTQVKADEALSEYVAMWRKVAQSQKLSKEFTDLVEQRLGEAFASPELKDKQVYAGPGRMAELEIAIRNFMSLHQSPDVKGIAYWLAYCMVESAQRQAVCETDKLPDDYQAELQRLADQLRKGLLNDLKNEPRRQELEGDVELAVQRFCACMAESIRRYRSDVLCPVFRKPIDDNLREAIQTRMQITSFATYPGDYSSLGGRSVNHEGYWQCLQSCVDRAAWDILYGMFVTETRAGMRNNKYWGPMNFSAGGGTREFRPDGLLYWPAETGIKPSAIPPSASRPRSTSRPISPATKPKDDHF